ncbi:MAG: hypothetical protein NC398_10045 [Acetatifactor muris]|nr:hypothetical protein [Acetatifactor muris]MCM1525941.1 hypothetical protein [Bacteroides sp.]
MEDKLDKQDVGRYISNGYSFFSEKDAALAETESRKVEYLNAHLDYDNPESVLRIYKKAISERIFKSPVGLFFLKELQSYLAQSPGIDSEEINAIPLYVSFDTEFREQPEPVRSRVRPAPVPPAPKKSPALWFSVILNLGLVAAVIAMFAITLNADQPNILNYEREITNRYASWEQELTERENAVRERERELNVELNEALNAETK